MKYERRSEPLLPLPQFLMRLARTASVAVSIVVLSLAVGVVGYRYLDQLTWVDAFLNASMILSGMGPVSPLISDAAKIFAACYALFAGVVVLTVAAVLFAPVYHRIIHRFHLVDDDFANDA